MRTVILCLILSVGCIGMASAASIYIDSNRPDYEENLQKVYDNRLQPYAIEYLAKRAALPYSGGIYGKRAALPYSGGIYGKRASVPFSGGIYGKRSVDEAPVDHVNGISIRAMPINGGFYG
ncbi:unnamed protein product [Bursaphelenchus xylophilus]|uniref:(pine wood nematode) hypothetical protein n=1 Tax=Bursaphelenchus xylophilus TaxID=6326 RepID=A0A1I7SSY0_BURXY|nr:unnamed protein product [Bursaphelenchus xylophilus]CAG9108842.1 unnamed protein product [Bursaphelenchus xylophilus]